MLKALQIIGTCAVALVLSTGRVALADDAPSVLDASLPMPVEATELVAVDTSTTLAAAADGGEPLVVRGFDGGMGETTVELPAAELPAAEPVAGPLAVVEPDLSGDSSMIQVIELSDSPPASDVSTESEPTRFQMSGRAVIRGDALVTRAPHFAPGTGLPFERGRGTAYLFARAAYSPKRWFEANLSGLLMYNLLFYQQGDPSRQSRVYPDLREAYLSFYQQKVQFRVGQQRVAWGVTDSISPNDVVNAYDRRNPFLLDYDLLALPTPTARLDVLLGALNLQAVVGMFVPDRFDLYGTAWSVVQPTAPQALRGFLNAEDRSIDPSIRIQFNDFLRQTKLPLLDRHGTAAGMRASWRVGALDVQHYYHYGYDSTPNIVIDPRLGATLNMVDWAHTQPSDVAAALGAFPHALAANFVRRHHVGSDAALIVGPVALRIDLAYDSKRVSYTRNLLGFVSPAIRGALGVEWQTGEIDKVLLVEFLGQYLVDEPPVQLLAYRQATFGAAVLIRWPLFDPLKFEMRTMASFGPGAISARPEVYYERSDWRISVGGLILQGQPGSFGNYFHYGNELYGRVAWSF